MKFLSICSGIEAASVAWNPLGWQASGFSEIEPFPCAVLAHHYPDVPNHGNMMMLPNKIRAGEVQAPDLLCGGTPCQAFSVAGLRQSLDDARGNLSLTFCEIADAIDSARISTERKPAIIFWENVPGVLNTKDNAFGCFLGALAGEDDALVAPRGRWANAGFVDGPQRAVAWRVLDAQYFGVAQRRRRVFVIASARADFDPAAVLFEFEGVRRDIAPSREKGKDITGSTGDGIARCITAGEMKRQDWETCTMVAQSTYAIQGSMIGRNDNAGPQGDGINKEVCFTQNTTDRHAVAQPIAFEPGKLKRLGYGDAKPNLCPTLRADAGDNQLAVAQSTAAFKYTMGAKARGIGYAEEQSPTLDTKPESNAVIQPHMAVRRLTPVECERLQGFPDNYTNIPWRKSEESPDGPRYKALGNSWAVPVVRWIGERIARSLA
jgi:DNA (cytosine-5)-methyltransferase 1